MDLAELAERKRILALLNGALAGSAGKAMTGSIMATLSQRQDQALAQARYQEYLDEIARNTPPQRAPLPAHDDVFRTGRRGPAFVTYGGISPLSD